jgi:hypothetical protein
MARLPQALAAPFTERVSVGGGSVRAGRSVRLDGFRGLAALAAPSARGGPGAPASEGAAQGKPPPRDGVHEPSSRGGDASAHVDGQLSPSKRGERPRTRSRGGCAARGVRSGLNGAISRTDGRADRQKGTAAPARLFWLQGAFVVRVAAWCFGRCGHIPHREPLRWLLCVPSGRGRAQWGLCLPAAGR